MQIRSPMPNGDVMVSFRVLNLLIVIDKETARLHGNIRTSALVINTIVICFQMEMYWCLLTDFMGRM